MLNTITKMDADSPLRGKASVGERLISINGHEIQDVLDYRFYAYDSRLHLVLEDAGGRRRTVKVKKPEGMDLGLDFEEYLMDNPRGCRNKCAFCFIDQLPKGMRSTLYFKDDDARLSFLTGSYITLTNLSEREIQRICDLRISPINISVHTTNPELRVKLMGNRNAGNILERLGKLAEAQVTMDCQIVCCPGYNDREELSRSMRDLAELYPAVNSVSIVPVGLTKFREGLFPLEPFDRERAGETIDRVEAFAEACYAQRGSHIFYCSDELYLKAGRELPPDEYYEDYSQLENGVGLIRLLETEFAIALEDMEPDAGSGAPFSVATGVSAAPLINKLLLTAQDKCANIMGKVYAIENDFFGHTIDVAGLITGGDLTRQLKGRELGERVLIPEKMLRQGEGVFLDDMTLEEACGILGVPVVPIGSSGEELLAAMLGE